MSFLRRSSDKAILPQPDGFGNYWFGGKDGPAIFSSGRIKDRFFVSLGVEGGIVYEGPNIRYFNTAGDALKVLQEKGVV